MNINDINPGASVFSRLKRSKPDDPDPVMANRVPYLDWVPHGFRPHFIAMCGEFVGTWLFLFTAFAATQVANTTDVGQQTATTTSATVLYVSLAFGFSLAVNAWVFFRISGGLFNPAVTLGMCLVGALSWLRGGILFVAQMLGAMASAAVVSVLFPGALAVTTTLGGGTSVVQGLFIEMFLTAQLVFTIFMLAAEKHKATFIAPVGIGLSLFVAELTGVYFTGGSLNPARSFAPDVVLRSFPSYHWIYWVGPILGALLASAFYLFIKKLEYETANPGQDKGETDIDEVKEYDPERDAQSSTHIASHSRARPSTSRSRHDGARRNHVHPIEPTPGNDPAQRGPSHDIPRREIPGPSFPADASNRQRESVHSPDGTVISRDNQNHSTHRRNDHHSAHDTGRVSRDHRWPEGHVADAAGQRAYV